MLCMNLTPADIPLEVCKEVSPSLFQTPWLFENGLNEGHSFSHWHGWMKAGVRSGGWQKGSSQGLYIQQ